MSAARAAGHDGAAPVARTLLFHAFALLAACSSDPGPAPGTSSPHIVLISIDTLRADHLGCYGYARDTSPNIDRLAREALVYTHALAPAPWTLPSHASMLTGIHSLDLGLGPGNARIPGATPMLAQGLQAAGYETAAFVDSLPQGFVGAERGFARGFTTFRHAPHASDLAFEYEIGATMDAARSWLQRRDTKRPFFLFLHTKAVHSVPATRSPDPRHPPYYSPEPHASLFLTEPQSRLRWGERGQATAAQHLMALNHAFAHGQADPRSYPTTRLDALRGLYDGAIHAMDEHIGAFLHLLDELQLSEHTLVILTADHGEAFLEHDLLLHLEVHRQLLHVPLIVRLPDRRATGIVQVPVALEDIVPTLLTWVGARIPAAVTGIPLPLQPDAPAPERSFFSHYEYGDIFGYYRGYGLERGDWKLVHEKLGSGAWTSTLYDVTRDPAEASPLSDRPDLLAEYQAELLARIGPDGTAPGETLIVDPETLEHLEALGYTR